MNTRVENNNIVYDYTLALKRREIKERYHNFNLNLNLNYSTLLFKRSL